MAQASDMPHSDDRAQSVRGMFRRSMELKQKLIDDHADRVVEMADLCIESLCKGGKLLLCGNGGSAADAQHLAAEMLVRLRPHIHRRALPAIALAMDSSSLTASGNDNGYESHFERMTQAPMRGYASSPPTIRPSKVAPIAIKMIARRDSRRSAGMGDRGHRIEAAV